MSECILKKFWSRGGAVFGILIDYLAVTEYSRRCPRSVGEVWVRANVGKKSYGQNTMGHLGHFR